MLQVITDKQCSECSSINQCETFNRDNEYIIKCKNCGHEKIISVMTTSITEIKTNTPIISLEKKTSNTEIF